MADIKTLQTRIALKYDTYANWIDETKEGLGAKLVLLAGEIGLCEIPSSTKTIVNEKGETVQVTTAPTVLFKVGNGTDPFKALPWASAKAADVYDWAKKSEEDFKTWLSETAKFATDEEVAAAVAAEADLRVAADNALDARITAVEGSVGTGKVAEDIEAIKDRLDAIEGTEGVDGTIVAGDKATLASAKTYAEGKATEVKSYVDGDFKTAIEDYADGKASAAQSAAEATADAALEAYKTVVNNALAGKQNTIPENTYDAYGDAEAVKTYVDNTVVPAANTYAEGKATAAETNAKTYAKGLFDDEVSARDAADQALGGRIDELTTVVNGKETAGAAGQALIDAKAYTDQEIVKEVTRADSAYDTKGAAAAAQTAAEATAAGALASAVGALEAKDEELSGAISGNTAKINTLIGSVEGDGNKSVRVIAAEETAKIVDGANEKYDTLKEIADFIMNDSTGAAKMANDIAANAGAISDLKDEFDTDTGRVKVAEAAIAQNAADIEAIELDLSGYKTTVSGELDKKLDKTTYNAFVEGYTTDKATFAINSDVETALNGKVDNATLNSYYTKTEIDGKGYATTAAMEAADSALQSAVDAKLASSTFDSHLVGHAKSATEITTEITTAVNGEKSAREAADLAINNKIGGSFDATNTVAKAISDVSGVASGAAAAAEANGSALTTLTGRVDTAEGKVSTLEGIVGGENSGLVKSVADLVALTGDASKGNVALYNEVVRVASLVEADGTGLAAVKAIADKNKEDIATNAADIEALEGEVNTIKGDYLKQADQLIFYCGNSSTESVFAEPAKN